jgi:hypothetical protein
MVRPNRTVWITMVAGASLGVALAAQTISTGQTSAPPRDGPPPPPTVRRIPIGTSSLTGTISAADTGKPVRGARVSVSGTVSIAATGPAGSTGGVPAGVRGGITGGVSVQSQSLIVGGAQIPVEMMVTGRGGVTGLSRTVLTDASGQFSFQKLPAGQFSVSVFQPQFLQVNYGQKRPGGQGTPIRLADGQKLDVKIQMMRGGVITGTIYGEDGEPQRGIAVRASRQTMLNGVRRWQQTGFANTDDRGVYRLFGLQPGDYMISATPNSAEFRNEFLDAELAAIEQAIAAGNVEPPTAPGLPPTVSIPINRPQPGAMSQPTPPPAYLPVFAPSSLIPSGATTVTMIGGDEKSGIDIQLRLAQASQVQGSITTALEPGVAVQISLTNDDPTMDTGQFNSARLDQNGRFSFRAIAPGKYTVFAQTVPAPPPMTFINGQPVQPQQPAAPPRLTDAQKLWGRASVTVEGQSVVEVNLPLRPARTISGVMLFEMAKPPDLTRSRLMVYLTPAPSAAGPGMMSSPPSAQVEPDGRFTLTGVLPGRYFLRGSIGVLKSAVAGGHDAADLPLDFTGERDITDAVITVTDQSSELSGTIFDAAGKPAPDYTVMVASTDSKYWIPSSRRVVMSRPAPDGRYMFRSLPPGEYVLAVIADFEQGTQYDPEFLKSLATGAMRVSITEGGKVSQDLRVR